MKRRRFSVFILVLLALAIIFNVLTSGISAYGFILPLIFSFIGVFCLLNMHESGAFFFIVLAASVLAGGWISISPWIFLVGIPLLYLLVSVIKKPVKEIDVDNDLTNDTDNRPESNVTDTYLVVPKNKWVILSDYKLKKQAFTMPDELELNTVLGDAFIDLNRAIIEDDTIDFACMTVLGETRIKLPEEWSATVEIISFLSSVKALGHKEEGFLDRATVQFGDPNQSFGHMTLKVTAILGDVKLLQKKQK